MDWKAILALAVLAMPLAWCANENEKQRRDFELECFKAGGVVSWGNCVKPEWE